MLNAHFEQVSKKSRIVKVCVQLTAVSQDPVQTVKN